MAYFGHTVFSLDGVGEGGGMKAPNSAKALRPAVIGLYSGYKKGRLSLIC